jgi:biotin synthase
MEHHEILNWLREPVERQLEPLWQQADAVRRDCVGDAVHLRGLIEISNHCARQCSYCGLRGPNTKISRYRMTANEIVACAHQAVTFGYGTVVLQAGEYPNITTDWVTELVQRIIAETPLAVTLSLGERTREELELWRAAGADRYLLRFESSNPALFEQIHPPRPGGARDRLALLGALRQLGYEVGSGVMIGIPGQTYDDLVNDLELFEALDLDMIGVGPFLPHPETPLGELHAKGPAEPLRIFSDQVPNTESMTYKVVALARLLCPHANIPSTTALATLNRANGRELGLRRGANIIMPNLTPPEYRSKYEIYPAKACLYETAEACHGCIRNRIHALGRTIGTGRGDSPNWRARLPHWGPACYRVHPGPQSDVDPQPGPATPPT